MVYVGVCASKREWGPTQEKAWLALVASTFLAHCHVQLRKYLPETLDRRLALLEVFCSCRILRSSLSAIKEIPYLFEIIFLNKQACLGTSSFRELFTPLLSRINPRAKIFSPTWTCFPDNLMNQELAFDREPNVVFVVFCFPTWMGMCPSHKSLAKYSHTDTTPCGGYLTQSWFIAAGCWGDRNEVNWPQ